MNRGVPLSNRLRTGYRLARAMVRDFLRYGRQAIRLQARSGRAHLDALLRMDSHRLEKGLALKEPRPGFGQGTAHELLDNLKTALDRFGPSQTTAVAIRALEEYLDFQRGHEAEPAGLAHELETLKQRLGADAGQGQAGRRWIGREQIQADARIDLDRFMRSRHSIRQFTAEPVDAEQVKQAVATARYTPSVCNRQNWRVYAFSRPDDIRRLLEHQNGNRGFGEQVPFLLLLTADLEGFTDETERHQGWLDGGMFAMSVVNALHARGLGTCCLNLCHGAWMEQRIRYTADIPDQEVLLMLIAVGHLPDRLAVAWSERKPLEEVLIFRETRPLPEVGEETI